MSFFRVAIMAVTRKILRSRLRNIDEEGQTSKILVFAPHQDDETLGCGGLIAKKRKEGVCVKIIFLTDGRKSHRKILPECEMAILREKEALKAAGKLGLESGDVFFLRFPSGKLGSNFLTAVDRIYELFEDIHPGIILVPFLNDGHEEHILTNKIVWKALRKFNRKMVIYEYPIWFWNNWPWINNSEKSLKLNIKKILKGGLSCLVMIRDFRYGFYIKDIIKQKKEALDFHESQMKRISSDPEWLTLSDLGNGDFIKCFFNDYEIFKKIEFSGGS